MPKAKRSATKRARHKKWLKRAKGYRGSRSRVFKRAKEAVLKAGQHAYHDRRKKKSVQRGTWQIRINAAVREHGMSYARFIHGLRQAGISLDRKVLSHLAGRQPEIFARIAKTAKSETEGRPEPSRRAPAKRG